MVRKVLRRGGVGFWLAFITRLGVLFVYRGRGSCAVMLFEVLAFRGVRFVVGSVLLFCVINFFLEKLLVVRLFVVITGASQGFTGKHFNSRAIRWRLRWE
jgi:hypothetical protein